MKPNGAIVCAVFALDARIVRAVPRSSMTLPRCLSLTPLARGAPPVPKHAGTQLRYTLVSQAPQAEWCWASVSSAVSGFFDPTSARTKCSIVNEVLGGAYPKDCVGGVSAAQSCCKSTGGIRVDACREPGQADHPARLACGLLAVGHFGGFHEGPMTLDAVRAELEGGRPIGAWIRWRGGANHFVVITGVDPAHGLLTIADPLTEGGGSSEGHWTTMRVGESYRGSSGGLGTWSGSYTTVRERPTAPEPDHAH